MNKRRNKVLWSFVKKLCEMDGDEKVREHHQEELYRTWAPVFDEYLLACLPEEKGEPNGFTSGPIIAWNDCLEQIKKNAGV